MKTIRYNKGMRGKIIATLLVLCMLFFLATPLLFTNGATFVARAAADDVMTIQRYDVDMSVQTDRKVVVKETIVMTANKTGRRFTRALPLEGARYFDVSATCVGENASYYVEDEDEYLNLVCELYTPSGTTRTYELAYTMEQPRGDIDNGMQIDVVGFGWSVPLHNVSVTMHFPDRATIEKAWISRYGEKGPSQEFSLQQLSADGKTLVLKADKLNTYYNVYDEKVAEGVYVKFTFADGVLQSYFSTQVFPDGAWKILVFGGICVIIAFVIGVVLRKKREIITTVNIAAPDDMDPMKMGKWLDGNVDSEDVTSMIYYFAHKGYLTIDFGDENNPFFTKIVDSLPDDAPAYEKTLFDGLFKSGKSVYVSDLQEKFYQSVDKAKKQLATPKMYDGKSVFAFVFGGILALLFALLMPFWLGRERIGGRYIYLAGVAFIAPIVGVWAIATIRENYRYKWKKGKQAAMLALQIAIMLLGCVLFVFAFASHILTRWEKLYISASVALTTFATTRALSRTKEYTDTLGQILGFKDFIVVTEEEKIKFMLEENPQLYYKVLPYAQVLGVTDEWEKKFKNILIEPPTWAYGLQFDVFDFLILNACLRRGMITAMMRPRAKGGSFIGRSGGGGGFGGFGGGGFGGGGGSWS